MNKDQLVITRKEKVMKYCQNFRGGSLGQVEAVDVAKWRQKLI